MNRKKIKKAGLMFASIIIVISFVYGLNMQPAVFGTDTNTEILNDDNYSYGLFSFKSYEDFSNFLNNCSSSYHNYGSSKGFRLTVPNIVEMDDAVFSVEAGGLEEIKYSETNIQVQGVDEPDTVKTDGTYIYIVSGQNVFIVLAHPSQDARVLSNISVNFTVKDIFVNEDRLVLFGDLYSYDYPPVKIMIDGEDEPEILTPYPWYSSSSTKIQVYDVSDRENPELKKDILVGGNYYNARMIGDYVYLITNQYSSHLRPCYETNETIVPMIQINGEAKKIPLSDMCCIDVPSSSLTLTHIVSLNVKDDSEEVVDKIFTLGNTQTMYVSKDNIYITYQRTRSDYPAMQDIIDEVVMPLLSEKLQNDIKTTRNFDISDYNKNQIVNWILDGFYSTLDSEERNNIETEIQRRIHRTVIHKISVEDGSIEYLCNGTVPGRALNQFSMDEHNGFFRIATQIDGWWDSNIKKSTNVYILDENLDRVSEVENIAPGENMHSARFMGNRAYLVTFKNIDPFFVLDLSDPENPEILGELKIPGYSDYLHPYDETHIIGIGKDSDETIDADKIHSEDAVYYTAILGVKIALFDVSDPENPQEVSKVTIGDRGTSTEVLNNHKALLFDREKELLVLPINLYESKEDSRSWGEFSFQGAYVYKLSIEDGFDYQGRITHKDHEENPQEYYSWYRYSSYNVDRSLFIGDVLYTISDSMIKMNSLDDLSEINSVELN